jgi:branched-chain amino acid transport system permease protein
MEKIITLSRSDTGPRPAIQWVLNWLERHPALGIAIILPLLPLVIPQKTLASEILIFGLLGASYNLLMGYTGLLSLGHSTVFGLGAYAAALLLAKTPVVNLWLALFLGAVVPGAVAIVIGWLSLRRRLVYFAMLTLAFNQMVYYAMQQARGLTGGDDGLRGVIIPPFQIFGLSFSIDSLQHPYAFYYVACVVVILCLLFMQRIIQSPFGHALQAIRENEERAQAVGYDTNRLQLMAFMFASMLAGMAGALMAIFHGFVALESLGLFFAIVCIIITVLGGKGTFVGPFVGTALYLILQEYISRYWANWQLALGLLFVLLVLFLPQGLWGTFKSWYYRRLAQNSLGPDELPLGSDAEVERG